jgi:hypothetical protein
MKVLRLLLNLSLYVEIFKIKNSIVESKEIMLNIQHINVEATKVLW